MTIASLLALLVTMLVWVIDSWSRSPRRVLVPSLLTCPLHSLASSGYLWPRPQHCQQPRRLGQLWSRASFSCPPRACHPTDTDAVSGQLDRSRRLRLAHPCHLRFTLWLLRSLPLRPVQVLNTALQFAFVNTSPCPSSLLRTSSLSRDLSLFLFGDVPHPITSVVLSLCRGSSSLDCISLRVTFSYLPYLPILPRLGAATIYRWPFLLI